VLRYAVASSNTCVTYIRHNFAEAKDIPCVVFLEGHVLLFALLLHVVEGHVGLARKNNRRGEEGGFG
jgi:hypothetical protein